MVRILNNYTKMLKRGIKMELVKNIPTDEELYYQQQQELMLQLQSISSMEQEKYRYHPSYYTHDVQTFLIEREQLIDSTTTRH